MMASFRAAIMQGKNVVLGLLGAIVLVGAVLFWIGMSGGSTHVPAGAPGVGFVKNDAGSAEAPGAGASGAPDGGKAAAGDGGRQTVLDRKLRDQLRQKLLAAWAASPDEAVATAARGGRFLPMPERDGGGVDPEYIRGVIRSDLVPLAKGCYEELLGKHQDAGGQLTMSFTIVGDENVGGIVESAEVTGEGHMGDEKLTTCMRESMLSLAFGAPPRGGAVTVTYPIRFDPDGEPPPAGGKDEKGGKERR